MNNRKFATKFRWVCVDETNALVMIYAGRSLFVSFRVSYLNTCVISVQLESYTGMLSNYTASINQDF